VRRALQPPAAATAPTSSANEVVAAVGDELAVDAEQVAQRAVDLRGAVVGRAQPPHRALDEGGERGHVGSGRDS
jgi:hypothetical protein